MNIVSDLLHIYFIAESFSATINIILLNSEHLHHYLNAMICSMNNE